MECPYCRREMKSGVVQSGHVVWFSETERSLLLYQGLKKGDIPIIEPFWRGKDPSAPAFYCEHCKKITVHLEGD